MGVEMFILIMTNLMTGIIICIIGLIIQTGKANMLIAGYNTSSEEKKATWDVRAMYKFVGWRLLVIPGLVLILACIPIALNIFPWVSLAASWILFVILIIGGVIFLNVNPRFKVKT